MLALLVLIVFGLGVALFAVQNTSAVTMAIGSYQLQGVPLYVIVVGSMIFGVFVAWLTSLVSGISTMITLHGKDHAIRESEKTVNILKEQVHKLELEISSLKGEVREPVVEHHYEDTHERHEVHHPTFMERLRQGFSFR